MNPIISIVNDSFYRGLEESKANFIGQVPWGEPLPALTIDEEIASLEYDLNLLRHRKAAQERGAAWTLEEIMAREG
jgi:hypothetical protein